ARSSPSTSAARLVGLGGAALVDSDVPARRVLDRLRRRRRAEPGAGARDVRPVAHLPLTGPTRGVVVRRLRYEPPGHGGRRTVGSLLTRRPRRRVRRGIRVPLGGRLVLPHVRLLTSEPVVVRLTLTLAGLGEVHPGERIVVGGSDALV